MDVETKGVTCKIPLDLHNRISAEIRDAESTMSKFIEMVIREHYEKGDVRVMAKGRTLAFQVSEELFQRIKAYLERYERQHHRRLTQREFVIGLIEQALGKAEEELEAVQTAGGEPEPDQAGLAACVPACDGEAAGDGSVLTESQESAPGDCEAGYETSEPAQEPEATFE
ncbi:MAG: translation initiation factor 2 [Clostridiales bacterium]|nr:translation initiation factor 2 [Clostridiales bacterium]